MNTRQKQPNSRHCFVCGVENLNGLHVRFYNTAPGEVTGEVTIPSQFQGYPGIVHGGVVAAMLDEAAGRTHMRGDPPRWMVTAQLNVRYRKPVPVEVPLRILGHAGEVKGRVGKATGEIYAPDGSLLADAEIVVVDMPAGLILPDDVEALDWKVYPDEEQVG
jgi:acyl-coenzyme A thioesterase PaaI-like protein